jgi:hypothetical protein
VVSHGLSGCLKPPFSYFLLVVEKPQNARFPWFNQPLFLFES